MSNKAADFCELLSNQHAPVFLFLGQNYLRLGANSDVLLDTILKKYNTRSSPVGKGYFDLLDLASLQNKDSVRAWISERANALTTSRWLDVVSEYQWNSVYTSAFDGMFNRVFRRDWRQVQPVYSQLLQPLDPRNRTKLHINYIYGCIERDEQVNSSPLDSFDLLRREPVASAMMQRIPEALTPLGVLAIEAYDDTNDWLTVDKLYPTLMALEKGQAFMFSTKVEDIKNQFLLRVISEGKLVVLEESLVSVLMRGLESGVIANGSALKISPNERAISLGKEDLVIPTGLWDSVSRFATIFDRNIPGDCKSQSPEKRYGAFRAFLAESGNDPDWTAFAQKLQFERDCENHVFDEVKFRLNNAAFNSEPVVLHGQTGSGKTIALASVALRIHAEKNYAVLFVARRSQRFNQADMDSFCQWAEDNGFPATLIVWDGMLEVSHYALLHKYLLGRGRKFVLLASAYKSEDEGVGGNCVLAPSLLTDNEIPRFKDYLSSFEPSLGEKFSSFLRDGDSSFLVAMYRLLPESRSQVRKGLNLEAGAATISIRSKSDSIKSEFEAVTILQLALAKAGLLDNVSVLPSKQNFMAGEWVSAEQELIGLVMVPGRFGLQVPIEVLLRAVSKVVVVNFHKVIEGIDLFRWSEDGSDNISIGPRHALEAKLISQSRLGGVSSEIEYAKKLLLNIRPSLSYGDTQETQFASEFVKNLGQNGPEKKLYSAHYLDLADTLAELRENSGIKSPRLMLQEASLLRESIVLNLIPETNLVLRLDVLERAQVVLVDAISEIGSSKGVARLKCMLLNELASTHGTRAREHIRAEQPSEDILREFNRARMAAMEARTVMPEDLFPIDVIAWCTKDVLTHAKLEDKDRLELIVNLFNVLALCEGGEISTREKEILERRRYEFSLLLGDKVLGDESLAALERLGSTAGIYLHAVHLAQGLPVAEKPLSHEQLINFSDAVAYLESNYVVISEDAKCLYLYLRYWWNLNSRLPFFPSERTAIPFKNKQWAKALDILETLFSLDVEFTTPPLLYLQAICKWHLGYYDDAEYLWRELERISDRVTGRRRVLKTYIASDEDGLPLKFNGTVGSVSEDGAKGEVFVEGIRRRVKFFPRDFRMKDVGRDEQLSGFHIAFNYIAPTADPAHHYSSMKRVGHE